MSSITKKGEIESASRPLMNFGELNDNIIKGLTLWLRYYEQEFLCVSICELTYVSRNQIKESLLLKVKHSVKKKTKNKCSYIDNKWFLLMAWIIWDISYWKDYCKASWGNTNKMTYMYVLHIGLIFGSLQCLVYSYHSWLQSKTSTLWRKIETSTHALFDGF